MRTDRGSRSAAITAVTFHVVRCNGTRDSRRGLRPHFSSLTKMVQRSFSGRRKPPRLAQDVEGSGPRALLGVKGDGTVRVECHARVEFASLTSRNCSLSAACRSPSHKKISSQETLNSVLQRDNYRKSSGAMKLGLCFAILAIVGACSRIKVRSCPTRVRCPAEWHPLTPGATFRPVRRRRPSTGRPLPSQAPGLEGQWQRQPQGWQWQRQPQGWQWQR
jgi:hypothetical protein